MLVEFEVKNFQSIRDAAALSMAAARDGDLADANTFDSGAAAFPRLLRSAAVYGPNGSGKTCLVRALRAMRETVLHSAKDLQRDEPLPVAPFLLDARSRNRPSEFEATFVRDGVRYQYGFAATPARVTAERLLAFPKGRPQRWIDRKYDPKTGTDEWGSMGKLERTEQAKGLWRRATRDNALFLSTAVQLNNEQLRPVYDWFADTLAVPELGGRLSPLPSRALCGQSETGMAAALAFLRTAGIDVDEIVLEDGEDPDADESPAFPGDGRRPWPSRVPRARFAYRLDDGTLRQLDWAREADGAREWFAYAAPVLQALREGSVLVVDELRGHLHPLLIRLLVELFQSPETGSAKAQLVFATHDTSLLNRRLFRRDQIWFCERKGRATQLRCLTDYSPRKDEENFERRYLSGRYGALPYVRSLGELHDVLDAGR